MRCRQQGFRPRDWPWQPASPRRPAVPGDFHPAPLRVVHVHAYRSRSLLRRAVHGDDELRRAHRGTARPADPGPARVVRRRDRGFHSAARHRLAGHEEDGGAGQGRPSTRFTSEEYDKKAKQAEVEKDDDARRFRPSSTPDTFVAELKKIAPKLELPEAETLKDKRSSCRSSFSRPDMIKAVEGSTVQIDQSLVSLAPLETLTIFFMVCLVSGLVLASPWVFYQIWAFVAAGLYRHERRYVKKYLPFSLGLFLAGVFLCFFFVLPITLTFLLQFNVWLGVAPTLAAQRMDELRHDPAADLRPRRFRRRWSCCSWSGSNLHGRRLPGQAEDGDPGHHDRRRGAHAGPGPVQHAAPGHPDDLALRAGHPHDRPQSTQVSYAGWRAEIGVSSTLIDDGGGCSVSICSLSESRVSADAWSGKGLSGRCRAGRSRAPDPSGAKLCCRGPTWSFTTTGQLPAARSRPRGGRADSAPASRSAIAR